MESKEKLKELMHELSCAYRYKIDKDLMRIYWEALRGYSDTRVAEAVRRALQTCKYFPRPAHIIEIVKESEPSTQTPDEWMGGDRCVTCGRVTPMLRHGECRNCYTGLSDEGIRKKLSKITKGVLKNL